MSATQVVESDVRRALDHIAVRDVVLKYARAVDRGDWELLRSCYHPEAIDDHGPFRGTIDEMVPWLQGTMGTFEFSAHYIMNQLVEFDGDDVAWVESYCLAYHRTVATAEQPDQMDWILNVRYVDRMERRDGEWRIADRRLAWEGGRYDRVGDAEQTKPLGMLGRRGRGDLAYDRGR
jgi:hypothetical protein